VRIIAGSMRNLREMPELFTSLTRREGVVPGEQPEGQMSPRTINAATLAVVNRFKRSDVLSARDSLV